MQASMIDDTKPALTADVTVITAAYSMERWPLTIAAVESVLAQTVLPCAIIIPVDHNPELFRRLSELWASSNAARPGPPITVVESRYDGHLGASATTAAEFAASEFLAFLDDDAAADADWLERMLAPFEDPSVIAVGGAPLPAYSKPRPTWFPHEFDWVFGCAYRGLPTRAEPILHLIGTTMAVRRADLVAIGGIHSNSHGDMELSHRLLERAPDKKLIYEPAARVRHFVPESRLTWSYFWRRCFFVNRSKVVAMRQMGTAGHLRAERSFALRALTRGVLRDLREFIGGDGGGLLRALAICAGVALAGAGYATGTMEWLLGRRPRGNASGWIGSMSPRDASNGVTDPNPDG
jgi:glucosyl-dolichyl phosphate glucuronosyltransferase